MWTLMLFAAASALLITFYTTALSLPWSLTLGKHLLIFCFSFVLMLPAVLSIAYGVYRLDTNDYLRQHERLRYLIQFMLLVFLLGAIALRVVYTVYLLVFGVDLEEGEYLERDFVVVMFCMIMVQVYYFIRKERQISTYRIRRYRVMQHWLLERDGEIKEWEDKEQKLQKEIEALQVSKRALGNRYENELEELRRRKQRLRANHEQLSLDESRLKACFKELGEQIQVMMGAENEWVRIPQIAYFYLKEGASKFKLVDVQLLDGRKGTVDMESLSKIEKRWPNLLFRAGRWLLIQHLAIKDVYKDGDIYILELYGEGQERFKVPVEVYDKLVKIRSEWDNVMSKVRD